MVKRLKRSASLLKYYPLFLLIFVFGALMVVTNLNPTGSQGQITTTNAGTTVSIERVITSIETITTELNASVVGLRATADIVGSGTAQLFVQTVDGPKRVFSIPSAPGVSDRKSTLDLACEQSCADIVATRPVVLTAMVNGATLTLHSITATTSATPTGAAIVGTPGGRRAGAAQLNVSVPVETTPLQTPVTARPTAPVAAVQEPTQPTVEQPAATRPTATPSIDQVAPPTAQRTAPGNLGVSGGTFTACGQSTTSSGTWLLTTPLAGTGTCINIINPNVILDCQNNPILFSNGTLGYGITIQASNVTVMNCNVSTNGTYNSNALSILVTSSYNNITIRNSRITNTFGQPAIYLSSPTNVTISSDTLTSTFGSDANSIGVYGQNVVDVNIINNTVVIANGTDNARALALQTGQHSSIINNTVSLRNSGTGNIGLYLLGQRNTISGNTIVTQGNSGNDGISTASLANTTIFNNTITTTGGSANQGILFQTSSTFNTAANNTITVDSSYGIDLETEYNTVSGNTITASGAGPACIKVSAHDSNVSGNVAMLRASSSASYGISVGSDNSRITNNIIQSTTNPGSRMGIVVQNGNGNTVSNNNISMTGTIGSAFGLAVYGTGTNNVVTNNTILMSDMQAIEGLRLYFDAINDTFANNTISVVSTSSYGTGIYAAGTGPYPLQDRLIDNTVAVNGSSSSTGVSFSQGTVNMTLLNTNITMIRGTALSISGNTTQVNNTIVSGPNSWLATTSATGNVSFTNTTIVASGTVLNIPGRFDASNNIVFDSSKFALNARSAFINTTNLTFLNTSAALTFTNLTGTNKQAIVNYDDGNGWRTCDPSVCTNPSFDASTGIFTMNVAHFTNYSTQDVAQINSENSSPSEWLMFGRFLNNTRYNPTTPPANPTNNATWFAAGGPVGIPVVSQGVLYVGGADDKVYALNASNVSQQFTSFNAGGSVLASPAVAGGVVYVSSADGRLYALNASNISQQLGNFALGGTVSSAAVADGIVYVGSNQTVLYALNTSNVNQQLANFTASGAITDVPAVADGVVYVLGGADVFALNASNISQVISNLTVARSLQGAPMVADGLLYVMTQYNGTNTWLYVLNASNVSKKLDYYTNGGYNYSSSMALANGRVYLSYAQGANSYVESRNASSLLWMEKSAAYTSGIFTSASTLSRDNLYVGSSNGNMYVLNASNLGQQFGSYPTGGIVGSAAIANNVVYAGSADDHLYAFGLGQQPDSCGNLTISKTLLNNVSSSGTCFTVMADNIVLDCAGFMINHSQSTAGTGIVIDGHNNVTVKNCDIVNSNFSSSYGISLNSGQNATIMQNTISVQGTASSAMFLNTGSNIVIQGNMIYMLDVGSSKDGLVSSCTNTNISDNVFNSTSSQGQTNAIYLTSAQNDRISNNSVLGTTGLLLAVLLGSNTANTAVTDNRMTMAGSATLYGIEIQGGDNNTVANNRMTTNGISAIGAYLTGASNNTLVNNTLSAGSGRAVYAVSASMTNTFINNTLQSNSSGFNCVNLQQSTVTFIDNNIIQLDTGTYGLYAQQANATFRNTLFSNTTKWFTTDSSSNITLINTTFMTANGGMTFPGNINVTGAYTADQTKLNLTLNNAFVNSTNLTVMNTSARITFNGITWTRPQIMADYNDGNGFKAGDPSICQNESYDTTNHVFTFNVTHFTNYSTRETVYPSISNVLVYNTTNSTALINWTTSLATNTTLDYGTTTALGSHLYNASYAAYHDMNITTLQNNTLYYVNITACDSVGDCNTTGPYNFTTQNDVLFDTQPPFMENITIAPSSPSTYNSSAVRNFSVDVVDALSSVDTVVLTINGSAYQVSGNGNRYTKQLTGLPAGTYYYNWTSNDSYGNRNTTQTFPYTVDRTTPVVTLSINPSNTTTYNASASITCSQLAGDSGTILRLYRNGTLLTSGTTSLSSTIQPAAGSYNITCTYDQSQNYNAASWDAVLTVDRANSLLNLTLDGQQDNITIEIGSTVNITANLTYGQGTLQLFQEGILINEGSSPLTNRSAFDSVGIYNITTSYAETENYSASSRTWFVKAADTLPPTVYLNKPADKTNQSDDSIDFNWTAINGEPNSSCTLTVDATPYPARDTLNDTPTNLSIGGMADGVHTWNVTCNDGYNDGDSPTRSFTIDTSAPLTENATIAPTSPAVYGSSPYNTSIDVVDALNSVDTVTIDWNGTVYSTTRSGDRFASQFTSLAAGTYFYNWTDNDSLGNKASTLTMTYTVNQATAVLNLTLNNSEADLFAELGDTIAIHADLLQGQGDIQVYENNTLIGNGPAPIDTAITPTQNGVYNITTNYTGNQNYTTASLTRHLTIRDTHAPGIYLFHPLDLTDARATGYNFTWAAVNTQPSMLCNLTIDGTTAQADITSLNDTPTNYSINGLPDGKHTWNVSCTDYSNINTSDTWRFTIDTTPPLLENQTTTPSSPHTYAPTFQYNFTIDASDALNPVGTVLFTFNGTTTIASRSGNTFSAHQNDLPAGSYNYNWTAQDTLGNSITTTTTSYTVDQAVSDINISITPANTLTYNASATLTCTQLTGDAGTTLILRQNGSSILTDTSPLTTTLTLAAGTYNFTCTYPTSHNYLATAQDADLRVDKAIGAVSLKLNGTEGDVTAVVKSILPIIANLTAGGGVIELLRDNVLVLFGTSPLINNTNFTSAGVFAFTANYSGNENFTPASVTHNVDVIDIGAPTVTLIGPLAGQDGNNPDVDFNWTSVDDVDATTVCNMTMDGSVRALDVTVTSTTPYNVPLAAITDGTHTWNVSCVDSAGNTGITPTRVFTIDTTPPLMENHTVLPPTPTAYGNTVDFNISMFDALHPLGTVTFTIDGTDYTPGQTSDTFLISTSSLYAGTHHYNWTASDSLGNRNTTPTYTYIITKGTPTLTLTASPGASVVFGTPITLTCNTTGDAGAILRLSRNGTLMTSGSSPLSVATDAAAGSYNYTCAYLTTQNYTAASTELDAIVAKDTGSVALTLDAHANDISVAKDATVAIVGTLTRGDGDITLYIDDGFVVSGPSPLSNDTSFDTPGVFNVTIGYAGDENFSGVQLTRTVTVTSPAGGGGGGGPTPPPITPPPVIPPVTPPVVTPIVTPPPVVSPPVVEQPAQPPVTPFTTTAAQGAVLSGGSGGISAPAVSCAKITKYGGKGLVIEPLDITKESVPIPAGYVLAADPFKLQCSGDELSLTINVPDGLTDLQVMRCRASECNVNVETTVTTTDLVCNGVTVNEMTKAEQASRRVSFIASDLAAIPTNTATIPASGGFVETHGSKATFSGLDRSISASLGLPSGVVHQPTNPSLSLVGAPTELRVSGMDEGNITVAMDIPIVEGLDPSSLTLVQWFDGSWHILDGSRTATTFTYTADKSMLHNGTAIVSLVGSVCIACKGSRLEEAYAPADATEALILVHGLFSGPATWDTLIREANITGQPFAIYTFGYPFTQPLQQSGVELADEIERIQAQYDSIAIVGHSAGGLVTQYALQHASESHKTTPQDHIAITKIRKVMLVAVPNKGILTDTPIETIGNYLLNSDSAAGLLDMHSEVLKEVTQPHDIPQVAGIDYYVMAGTADYGLPFTSKTEKTDGIVSTDSARHVGASDIDDACFDYFELNLTHTELIDDDTAIRVIGRTLFDAAAGKAGLGRNQYMQVRITGCDPRDTYWAIGKTLPPQKAPEPLSCGCGNGYCGVDETAVSCPQDCARTFTTENLSRYLPVVYLVILIAAGLILLLELVKVLLGRKVGRISITILCGIFLLEAMIIVVDALTYGVAPLTMSAVLLVEVAVLAVLWKKGKVPSFRRPPRIPDIQPHAPAPMKLTPIQNDIALARRQLRADERAVVPQKTVPVVHKRIPFKDKLQRIKARFQRTMHRSVKPPSDAAKDLRTIQQTEARREQLDLNEIRRRLGAIKRRLRK